jgi:ribonuclease P protein component
LIREAFRLHQHKIAGPVDLVCIARASIREKAFAAVETDFLRSLEQAGLMLKSSQ